MNKQFLNPPTLSSPTGYSHIAVVAAGRQIHLAGQVAFNVAGQVVGKNDLVAQAEQVFSNIAAALGAAGAILENVFKMVVYVVDLNSEKAQSIRAVRKKYLGDGPYPASTVVGVTSLVNPELLLEIEVIAAID
jgi:enamine deaminase RidA (YjgF/YER057c/UK114 family)